MYSHDYQEQLEESHQRVSTMRGILKSKQVTPFRDHLMPHFVRLRSSFELTRT